MLINLLLPKWPPSISPYQNDPPQSPHLPKWPPSISSPTIMTPLNLLTYQYDPSSISSPTDMTPLNLLTFQNDPPQCPNLLKNMPKSLPKSQTIACCRAARLAAKNVIPAWASSNYLPPSAHVRIFPYLYSFTPIICVEGWGWNFFKIWNSVSIMPCRY